MISWRDLALIQARERARPQLAARARGILIYNGRGGVQRDSLYFRGRNIPGLYPPPSPRLPPPRPMLIRC
jgi:hypothetical protein